MAQLTGNQAMAILRNLGFRIRTTTEFHAQVRRFQAAWNLGTALAVDGQVGPKTSDALLLSEKRRRARAAGTSTAGDASPHFSFSEVKCRCGGRYSSCPRIFISRHTFRMMESYRARSGRPMKVVSACRCKSHNAAVGGSATSRHVTGLACDVEPRYSVSTVKSWQLARNIGYGRLSRKVVHIDLGLTGGTLTNPRVYVDGN